MRIVEGESDIELSGDEVQEGQTEEQEGESSEEEVSAAEEPEQEECQDTRGPLWIKSNV